jgi:hypothetical protein
MKILPLLAAAAAALSATSTILATTVTFDDQAGTLANADQLPAGYGSTPLVTVDYESLNTADGSVAAPYVFFWHDGFGDLHNVVYAASNNWFTKVRLTPAPGHSLTLNSFDLAGFPQIDHAGVRVAGITDGTSNTLFLDQGNNGTLNVVDGTSHTVTFSETSAGAFTVRDGTSNTLLFSENTNAAFSTNDGYSNIVRQNDGGPVAIDGTSNTILFGESTTIGGAGPSHSHFAPGFTTTTGVSIIWGPDWNVGIDNINYSVDTPEPASAALLATAATGLLLRRRRHRGQAWMDGWRINCSRGRGRGL